jgi:hypothetical protein
MSSFLRHRLEEARRIGDGRLPTGAAGSLRWRQVVPEQVRMGGFTFGGVGGRLPDNAAVWCFLARILTVRLF